MTEISHELHPGKIRWKCRRGMLELDMILLKFFDEKFLKLPTLLQRQFSNFLNEPDPVLFNWFLAHMIPEDKEHADMVNLILDTPNNQRSDDASFSCV